MDELLGPFLDRVRSGRDRLKRDFPDSLLRTAVTTLSIVRNRSIQNGIFVDAQEGNTVEYSTSKLPTFFFANKVRNQAGRDFIKKNKLGSYLEFRVAQGLRNVNINLSYTGRMWSSFLPGIVREIGKGIYEVEISSSDGVVAQYLVKLIEEYGDFYDPTEREADQAFSDMIAELEMIFAQYT